MNLDLIIPSYAALSDVRDTVNQMFKKKLLPDRSRKLIYDNIKGMTAQYQLQVFKEWSCTICAITVQGPKFLLLQHQKIHADKRDIRENEFLRNDFKLY